MSKFLVFVFFIICAPYQSACDTDDQPVVTLAFKKPRLIESICGIFLSPPALTLNPAVITKPQSMKAMQWISLLEIERNKADYLEDFRAFEAFTREISATIGGKYGVFIRRQITPEEKENLIYLVIRTRHKFRRKVNILSDFYGVADPSRLQEHHKDLIAAILVVDSLVTKSLNDEAFAEQWAGIDSQGLNWDSFIRAVKEQAKNPEKLSVIEPLEQSVDKFFRSHRNTIVLANDVFKKYFYA